MKIVIVVDLISKEEHDKVMLDILEELSRMYRVVKVNGDIEWNNAMLKVINIVNNKIITLYKESKDK